MSPVQPPPLVYRSLLILLLLLILPNLITAQGYRNISLSEFLTATNNNSAWRSPSGDFAFGFRPLNDKDQQFLLAIWYDKIPDKTIVWYATNKDGGRPVPKGSKVNLTKRGPVLTDPQGKELWPLALVSDTVNYAAMLDTGNFILSDGDSVLWESFKTPTDTILPSQIMQVDINSVLYSRPNVTSYSKGRFRLRLLPDGNLVLNTVAFPSPTENHYNAYYRSDTFDTNISNAGYQLVFNETGMIYVVRRNGSIKSLWEEINPNSDTYFRATLDPDGVFVQYSHPRNSNENQTWSIVRLIPDHICFNIGDSSGDASGLGSGACGYNSYCVLTEERRPRCECPPEYSLINPNNSFGGCKPNFVQGCLDEDESKKPEDLFEFKTLYNVDWPDSDYERIEDTTEMDCRDSCMNDCLCSVAIFRAGCWKKKLPLSNGRSGGTNARVLIKVRKNSLLTEQNCSVSNHQDKKDRSKLTKAGSILLGSSVFLSLMFVFAIFLVFYLKNKKKLRKSLQLPNVPGTTLHSFTYKDLEEATNGFKEELGRGAFGIVYKGAIDVMGSTNHIAVKKLGKVIDKGEKEFKTEVSVIGQTHHKNLVRLLGFCEEGQHRLLVYEFMPNSSLADYLFGDSKPQWNQRIHIAIGIARGLLYLHEECTPQIIHCDIKPHNILLDESFTARISDFGLAKLLLNDHTRTLTSIRGTRGYVAPEWYKNTPITVKIDVYSFGVVLLEIICCRKNVLLNPEEDERAILTDWAHDCYRVGRLQDLVENNEPAINDMTGLERLVKIAIWCVQEEPSQRPSMKMVAMMLEEVVDVSTPPCPYSLISTSWNQSRLL